jgi:hypothetical protein
LVNALPAHWEFPVKMTLIRALTVAGLVAMSASAHAGPLSFFWRLF